jgi:integrase
MGVAYRHGLRASEVCDLQWQQIELSEGRLHVHRVKNGIPSVHPIRGDEMRALHKLRRCDYPKDAYVFVSERGGPINDTGRIPAGTNRREDAAVDDFATGGESGLKRQFRRIPLHASS